MHAETDDTTLSKRRLVMLAVLAWVTILAVDFFVHGGLLARLYLVEDDPFLLPPHRAFALIPLGYLSYAVMAATLTWLMARLRVRGPWPGALFGGTFGALMWGAFGLGLLSISTIRPVLALGWFVGSAAGLAAGGAVLGAGLGGVRTRRLVMLVIGLAIILAAATVAMQNTGLAPAVMDG